MIALEPIPDLGLAELPSEIMSPFVDWLSFSLPYESLNFDWIVEEFGKRLDREKGFMGYSHSFGTLFGALVGFTPTKKENKIHVVLSGKTLANLKGKIEINSLIEEIISKNGTFARIDIALDDFEGLLDLELIYNKLLRKEVSTRFKGFSRITGKEMNSTEYSRIYTGSLYKDDSRPKKSGDTIYIGSRSSDVFVRIYDKIKETKSNILEFDGKKYRLNHWNRLEFEFKRHASEQLCNPREYIDLLTGEFTSKKLGKPVRVAKFADRDFSKIAFYYLKFLEPKLKRKFDIEKNNFFDVLTNKKQWTVSDWWIDFLKASEGEKIGLSFIRPRLDGVRDWIFEQTSGAFFTLHQIFGQEYLDLLVENGKEKFEKNKRYQKLSEEFLLDRVGKVTKMETHNFLEKYKVRIAK